MLTIIAKVNAPAGQAIGVKEDLAMRFEDLGDVSIISVTEDKPMQLLIGGYEPPGAARRREECVDVPTKKKRLTQREMAERAPIKKQLQADGILPPDKPRLNRKKFAQETWEAYEAFYTTSPIRAEVALIKAIGFMVGPDMKTVSPEEVGVFKLLKLAVEYEAFLKKLEAEGRTKYNYGELIDEVILPVTNL